jgi:hypothetical protein
MRERFQEQNCLGLAPLLLLMANILGKLLGQGLERLTMFFGLNISVTSSFAFYNAIGDFFIFFILPSKVTKKCVRT